MDKYKRIEAYLTNTLSLKDKLDFENEMSKDSELYNDVQAHAKMKLALNALIEEDVKSQISKLRTEGTNSLINKNSTKQINLTKRRKILSIAASVLVLICVGWWWSTPSLSMDSIFHDYYKEPKSELTRSGDETGQNSSNTLDTYLIQYYEGHELIKLEKYNEAFSVLENMNLPKDHELVDNRTWFMALLKLKLDPDQAKKEFRILSADKNHKYRSEIKEVLGTID